MCRTGDVTAHPIPEEGHTHRFALQFSSLAFLIVEESGRKEILSPSVVYEPTASNPATPMGVITWLAVNVA